MNTLRERTKHQQEEGPDIGNNKITRLYIVH